MDALAQDASLSMDAQKEKKMALKKEKEGKLFEFLTPEQQQKYNDGKTKDEGYEKTFRSITPTA